MEGNKKQARENTCTRTQTHCHSREEPFVASYMYFGSIIECVRSTKYWLDGFGGLVVRRLASGSRIRGFNPAEAVGFFCV
jgi:hypothetical protein